MFSGISAKAIVRMCGVESAMAAVQEKDARRVSDAFPADTDKLLEPRRVASGPAVDDRLVCTSEKGAVQP
jgi:hypothetical protein